MRAVALRSIVGSSCTVPSCIRRHCTNSLLCRLLKRCRDSTRIYARKPLMQQIADAGPEPYDDEQDHSRPHEQMQIRENCLIHACRPELSAYMVAVSLARTVTRWTGNLRAGDVPSWSCCTPHNLGEQQNVRTPLASILPVLFRLDVATLACGPVVDVIPGSSATRAHSLGTIPTLATWHSRVRLWLRCRS